MRKIITVLRKIEIKCLGKYCSTHCDYNGTSGFKNECALFDKKLKRIEDKETYSVLRCKQCLNSQIK